MHLYPHSSYRFPDGAHVQKTLFSSTTEADIALLQADFNGHLSPNAADVEIGGYLDDWVDDQFILSRVLLMGYPRIPLASNAELVTVSGEINAVVQNGVSGQLQFIISSLLRLGFSGGPVTSEWGFLLGVMTERLFEYGSSEMPYAAVLSIEPIWELRAEYSVFPGRNGEFYREHFDGLFDRSQHIDGEARESHESRSDHFDSQLPF